MKEEVKNIKNGKNKLSNLKKTKEKRKESYRFLFDMIGRLFSR